MQPVREQSLTPGLTRALSKQKVRRICGCGFPMPIYPGRYPSKCPVCSTPRTGSKDGEGTSS